jgi:hypothetical protein
MQAFFQEDPDFPTLVVLQEVEEEPSGPSTAVDV